MTYTQLPQPSEYDGEVMYIHAPHNRKGLHYSTGKKWEKVENGQIDLNTKTLTFTDGGLKKRRVILNIDSTAVEIPRTIFMPDDDVYLGKLFNTDNWKKGDQFSWTHIQTTEELIIPDKRVMVTSELVIDGTLNIKGTLYLL